MALTALVRMVLNDDGVDDLWPRISNASVLPSFDLVNGTSRGPICSCPSSGSAPAGDQADRLRVLTYDWNSRGARFRAPPSGPTSSLQAVCLDALERAILR